MTPRVEDLRTKRLRFRRFTRDDIDLLLELDSDPEVMRWLTGGKASTREFYEEAMPRILATYESGPSRGTFGAEQIGADGVWRFVGWFHLKDGFHWPGELELGYRLRRSAWGRGLATEGSVALIRHALEDLGEPVVVAGTMLGNVGSQRVMVKAGMEFACGYIEHRWEGPDQRAVKYHAQAGRWGVAKPGDSV